MSSLLYIQASPRGQRSKSIAVADAFVNSCRKANPEVDVDTLNVFQEDLPVFDGAALDAKYAILHGQHPGDAHRDAWGEVEAVIQRFMAADKYILATPMWNFSIPYRLKHYIDLLVQPTYTFSFSPEEGYTGLVTGRPAMVVYARGGAYDQPELTPLDQQKPYVETILGFMGFEDIRSLVVEPTLMAGPDVADEKVRSAIAEAAQLGQAF
ncbi:MAG: FMN-dependent NADH-azoreductase [Planctomycetota bacterium]|jgi:FMN-dependent NADH-azoreductase